jgi:hypothetical protein
MVPGLRVQEARGARRLAARAAGYVRGSEEDLGEELRAGRGLRLRGRRPGAPGAGFDDADRALDRRAAPEGRGEGGGGEPARLPSLPRGGDRRSIIGLGGKDITPETIERCVELGREGYRGKTVFWPDARGPEEGIPYSEALELEDGRSSGTTEGAFGAG